MVDDNRDTEPIAPNVDPDSPDKKDTEKDLYFNKYETKEDFESAHKSLLMKLEEQGKENNALQSKINDDMLKAVSKLAEKADGDKPVSDLQTWLSERRHIWDEDETGLAQTRDIISLQESWLAASEKKSAQKIEELTSKFNELRGLTDRLDPEYKENQSLIDPLVEGGMSLAKAKVVAKELRKQMPALQPDRTQPPSHIDGRSVGGDQNGNGEDLSPDEVELFKRQYVEQFGEEKGIKLLNDWIADRKKRRTN